MQMRQLAVAANQNSMHMPRTGAEGGGAVAVKAVAAPSSPFFPFLAFLPPALGFVPRGRSSSGTRAAAAANRSAIVIGRGLSAGAASVGT